MSETSRSVRFAIIGSARTGSNLLWHSIDQHPRAACLGELFSPEAQCRDKTHQCFFPDGQFFDAPGGHYPTAIDYLEHKIWPAAADYAAFGFKVFYKHLTQWNLWDYFAGLADFRYIHLTRNGLAAYVSLTQSTAQRVWYCKRDAARPELPAARIEPDAVRKYVDRINRDRARARELPGAHLELSYAEVAGDFQGTMQKVFAFLDVELFEPQQHYLKLNEWDIRRRVANWDELASHLAGSHPELLTEQLV